MENRAGLEYLLNGYSDGERPPYRLERLAPAIRLVAKEARTAPPDIRQMDREPEMRRGTASVDIGEP